MTVADIVNDLRKILIDDIKPYRYSDSFLYPIVSSAYREVIEARPDLGVKADFSLPDLTLEFTSLTDTVDCDTRGRTAIVYAAVERVYLTEHPDATNLRQAREIRERLQLLLYG